MFEAQCEYRNSPSCEASVTGLIVESEMQLYQLAAIALVEHLERTY